MEKTSSPEEYRSGIVSLIGPPNAGKSTLLNTMLGQKVAIVTPKPQTTRNRISGILTREDVQIVFLDTPGIHQGKKRLNKAIVNAAWQAFHSSDAAVLILDGARYRNKPGRLEQDVAPLLLPLERSRVPLVIGVNKVDQVRDKKLLLPIFDRLQSYWPGRSFHPLSALKGTGVEEILSTLIPHLPPGPPLYPEDQISTAPIRFLTSEIIREKLFLHLKEELPYSIAVEVEHWEEQPGIVYINALIYVARERHKGMVVGRKGSLLKQVGRSAREEIEELVGKKVHLELWVKVRKDWPDNRQFLLSMGLEE
ncbi:MAG: GTPase Era [Desulfovibrionales bacterium]